MISKKLELLALLSAAFIISTALSGCIESGDGEKLDVKPFVFCSDVRGDGDYDLRLNKTYGPGEVVWMYFEVNNFGSQKISDQYATRISEALKIFYPNGDVYFSDSTTLVNEEGGDSWLSTWDTLPNHLWFKQGLPISHGFSKGKYKVEAKITDMISNKYKTIKEDFTIDYNLSASEISFGTHDENTGQDQANPTAIYKAGDIILTEFKLYNVEAIPRENNTFRLIISQPDFSVFDDQGEIVYGGENTSYYHLDGYVTEVLEYYSYVNTIKDTADFTPGVYTVVTRMVDGVSSSEVTVSGSFTITS